MNSKTVTISELPQYSNKEEWANSISHGIGGLASIVGLIFLLIPLSHRSPIEALKFSSFSIYGTSLILLFITSTVYHGVRTEKLRTLFQMFDHCAIYLLIAGSYTPLLLITIAGSQADIILAIIWSIAIVGIGFKIKFGDRFAKLSLFSYLAMGWCSLFVIAQLWQKLAVGGFALLLGGGLVYSLGTIFYSNHKIPYNHAIWHLFVLGGAACHYFMMLFYVK